MVKPEELQIGNFVSYKGKIVVVVTVVEMGINYATDFIYGAMPGYQCYDLEPILITQEYLNKFPVKDYDLYKDKIKYVHQLQNIHSLLK